MDDGENFRAILSSDAKLNARWEAVSDKIISDASRLLGVSLKRDDVVALPSARLAVLTEDPLSDSYLNEVKRLEAFPHQVRQRELREAVERGDQEALSSLPKNPAARIARARELGIDGADASRRPSSIADEATLLRRLLTLSPAERIAKARTGGQNPRADRFPSFLQAEVHGRGGIARR